MGIMVGSQNPKIMNGDNKVKAVYIGSTKVWSNAEPFIQTFTESQTWTIPDYVTKLDIFLVGGGGGGGASGGGGGYTKTYLDVSVTPLSNMAISIGAGGKGGSRFSVYSATNGEATTVTIDGTTLIANGGERGTWLSNTLSYPCSNGGSGGAGHAYTSRNSIGGSDGSYGGQGDTPDGYVTHGGNGQGTTTRAFGESNGTLYAGGGGGGQDPYNRKNARNPGGAGGGGASGYALYENGKYTFYSGLPGEPNTGGGGGGGIDKDGTGNENTPGGDGGSGVVIIRFNGEE